MGKRKTGSPFRTACDQESAIRKTMLLVLSHAMGAYFPLTKMGEGINKVLNDPIHEISEHHFQHLRWLVKH